MTEKRLSLTDVANQADRLYAEADRRYKGLEIRLRFYQAFHEIDPEGPWGAEVTAMATEIKNLSHHMVDLKNLQSKCLGHLIVEGHLPQRSRFRTILERLRQSLAKRRGAT